MTLLQTLINPLHSTPRIIRKLIFFSLQPVVLDVSGPHAKPPPDALEEKEFDKKATVIHIQHLLTNLTKPLPTPGSPTPTPKGYIDDEDDNDDLDKLLTPNKTIATDSTMDLWPDKPLVLYLWREHSAPKARVMKVMPSLAALKDNEVCQITHGNEDGLFGLLEWRGISSLHYTQKLTHKEVYKLGLTCRPLHNMGQKLADNIQLDLFTILLELHIL